MKIFQNFFKDNQKLNANEVSMVDNNKGIPLNKYLGNLSSLNTADKSSLVKAINEMSVVGKAISLTKNTQQNYNAKGSYVLNWEEEEFNTTGGILVKNGNSITCNSGTHTVLINSGLQSITTNSNFSTTNYLYIRRKVGEEVTEIKTISTNGFPTLTTLTQINEGENIEIHFYSNGAGRISNAPGWNYFQIILLD